MADQGSEILPARAAPAIEVSQQSLSDFLAANTYSSLADISLDKKRPIISEPWGEASFCLLIGSSGTLVEVLNNVILPERFSAIYHRDSRKLEVLWTAYGLPEAAHEINTRQFVFSYKGIEHTCTFGSSSERCLAIAESFFPLKPSETNFRNLQSFSAYTKVQEARRKEFSPLGPLSFWIDNLDWDEISVIEIVSNLNFYLKYYDNRSPIVMIHDNAQSATVVRERYLHGKFPPRIGGRHLDDNLLSFWNFCGSDPNINTMVQFILYYRIIEYSAFHYIDASIRAELRKVIMAPHFAPDALASIENIVGAFNVTKLEDTSRFRAVLQHCVRPQLLWPDVEKNLDFFSQETKFDGGFVAKPLVSKAETAANFLTGRVASFAETIRKIRNTLSHGKDQETAGVILPTLRNFNLLRPWVYLIATAAGEVVLNKDVT